MTTLTNKDVSPYTEAFKVLFGRETTLTLDDMEAIILSAESDMSPKDFAEAFKAAEVEPETDDRLPVERDERPGSAYSYAIKMDAGFQRDLETLANAAIENKRGGAVIMFDLFRLYGEETICSVWPKPGSYKPGQGHLDIEAGANEPWDKEDTTIQKVDGTTGKGVRSFYQELFDLSPLGNDLLKSKEELKKNVGDVRNVKPKVSAVDTKRTAGKGAIVRAVNLAQKMAFVNSKTGMQCEIVTDTDDDNKVIVAQSNKLIFIKDKTNQTKFDVITIGQFLALKVAEGATYTAIVGTTQRKPNAGTGPQAVEINVNTLTEFDKVTAAYATFFDKMEEAIAAKDMKAYNALLTHLNSAGSDDLLLSMNKIMNFIESVLSKPGIDKRLGALIADGGKADKAKAA